MTKQKLIISITIATIICTSIWLSNFTATKPTTVQLTYSSNPKNEYLNCQKCHQKEVKLWKESHHKKAMGIATKESVLGNFDNQSFTNKKGEKTRFFKKDNLFFINTIGNNGKRADYQVKFVFGFKPLQQYLFELDDGKVQCLSIAWDNNKKQWYPLYPKLDITHKDRLHWTNQGQNWNSMCASCHTTNFNKNYQAKTDSYNSTFDEINVSCSACHGDASNHIDMAEDGKLDNLTKQKRSQHKYGFAKGLIRNPVNSQIEIESCAPCHSLRVELKKNLNINEKFSDKYLLSLLEKNNYQDDGQLLNETYVHGSFVQSKMYHKGIRCSDCHNPHSNKLIAQGNNLCVRCHEPQKYNSSTHTKHKIDGQGSLCINCHMPGKNYMGIDLRRDHSFRVPRPDLSVKYQTPNACNNCHTDKTTQWASDATSKWFGDKRQHHFADLLLPARKNNDWKLYVKLLSSQEYPEIVRATAASELKDFLNIKEVIDLLLKTIKDKQILVRETSLRAFQKAPDKIKIQYIFPLLNDNTLAVRLAAYRVLVGVKEVNKKTLPEINKFVKVGNEYKEMLEQNADFPAGQFQYALYYSAIGDKENAEKAYLHAIKIDRYFAIARFNLANLYRQQKRFEKAKNQYLEIAKTFPQDNSAYFQLGLMYYSQKEYVEAIKSLKIAQKIQPNDNYIIYALGEIYLKLGRIKDAENQYLQALKIKQNDYTYLIALAKLYLYQKNLSKLDKTVKNLILIAPRDQAVFQLRFEYKKLEALQQQNNK